MFFVSMFLATTFHELLAMSPKLLASFLELLVMSYDSS